MKKITLLFTFLMAFSFSYAQISEAERPMSQGNKNGVSIELKKSNKKDVEKLWEKFMKDFKGKTKQLKKSDEYFTDDAKIEKMSPNSVDIYSIVTERGEDTELTAWFDLGGAYVASYTHAEAYSYAEKLLDEFRLVVEKDAIEKEIKMEEKNLKGLEKDLSGLEKGKENLENDIKKYEEKIAQAKKDIEQNLLDQDAKKVEIETQQGLIKKIAGLLNNLK